MQVGDSGKPGSYGVAFHYSGKANYSPSELAFSFASMVAVGYSCVELDSAVLLF